MQTGRMWVSDRMLVAQTHTDDNLIEKEQGWWMCA